MKWMVASASGMAGLQAMENMAAALARGKNPPALIWINDHGTDMNLLALLGNEVPEFLDLIQVHWNVMEHDGLMPTLHTPGHPPKNQVPILVVEQIPPFLVKSDPAENPLLKILRTSKAVVQLGTDACFGGMAIPPERVAQFDLLCRELKTPVIKLPGVPTPPHHVVGVLAHLEFFGFPRLDGNRQLNHVATVNLAPPRNGPGHDAVLQPVGIAQRDHRLSLRQRVGVAQRQHRTIGGVDP